MVWLCKTYSRIVSICLAKYVQVPEIEIFMHVRELDWAIGLD